MITRLTKKGKLYYANELEVMSVNCWSPRYKAFVRHVTANAMYNTIELRHAFIHIEGHKALNVLPGLFVIVKKNYPKEKL